MIEVKARHGVLIVAIMGPFILWILLAIGAITAP